jgi:hypothetical protein
MKKFWGTRFFWILSSALWFIASDSRAEILNCQTATMLDVCLALPRARPIQGQILPTGMRCRMGEVVMTLINAQGVEGNFCLDLPVDCPMICKNVIDGGFPTYQCLKRTC